jgi:hypothetical protein
VLASDEEALVMRVNCNCRKVSQEGDDLNWVSAPLGRSRVKRASGALEAIETKKPRQNLDRRRTHLWVLTPRLWSQTVCVVYQYSNSMCVSMTRNQRVARMRQINISLDSDSTRNTAAPQNELMRQVSDRKSRTAAFPSDLGPRMTQCVCFPTSARSS